MEIQMLSNYQQNVPDFAKDLRLNISQVLQEDSSSLSQAYIFGIALSCAYATKNQRLVDAILQDGTDKQTAMIQGAKEAASIMAMNNIYFRFVHFVDDDTYQKMPAKLRMNVITKASVDKNAFELYSLAISSINGCELCVNAHVKTLEKHGISQQQIQDTIRIAALISGLAQAEWISA
jgi:alkyl hydroperoxide reductase subunit D